MFFIFVETQMICFEICEHVCKVSQVENVQFERGLQLLFLTLERILFRLNPPSLGKRNVFLFNEDQLKEINQLYKDLKHQGK